MKKFYTAFLNRSQVPDRLALQEAIKGLRLKLTIDDSYVPFECAGYLPCTLDGEDAGFDIKFGDSAESLAEMPGLQSQIADRDTAICLRWGGDPRERVSAMIVSTALAQAFGTLVLGQGDDAFSAPDQLLKETQAELVQLQDF